MNIKRPPSKQPIPSNAQIVFSGKMFTIYQWKQKLFNGDIEIFEKLKRADTVTVIPVTTDGKIVLSEQEQPGTEPFCGGLGGKIDEGELPLDAAKRELMEEAGMEAEQFIFWDAIQPTDKIDWTIFTFIARNCRIVRNQNMDPGEKIKLNYVTFDEFLQKSADPAFRDSEISLKVFRTILKPSELKKMKKLFGI